MTFTLNVSFTAEQLENLASSQSTLIIAQPSTSSSSSTPNVAWLSINPLENNTITWQQNYGIYASSAQLINGATLLQASYTTDPASPGSLYTLDAAGAITGPTAAGTPPIGATSYGLLNSYSDQTMMTVGLYQSATVNSVSIPQNAISAAATLGGSTAVMTPYTTICLWIASSVSSNTVVTNIASPVTTLVYGGTTTSISVAYNTANDDFDTTGSSALANKVVRRVIQPAKQVK